MYLNYLLYQQTKLADTLLLDQEYAVKSVIDDYVQMKFIEKVTGDHASASDEIKYILQENKRPALEYYKNNCISFFIPAAYTALSILKKDSFQFSASDLYSGYTYLHDLFKYEFAQQIDKTPELLVRKTLKAFIDEAAIVPHPTLPDTYNITSA